MDTKTNHSALCQLLCGSGGTRVETGANSSKETRWPGKPTNSALLFRYRAPYLAVDHSLAPQVVRRGQRKYVVEMLQDTSPARLHVAWERTLRFWQTD